MKISQAKGIYSAQMQSLWDQKRELSQQLKEAENMDAAVGRYDRVELSQKLAVVEKQYDETKKVMEKIQLQEYLVHNLEAGKQEAEAMEEMGEEMVKIMVTVQRMVAGDKVPPQDEEKVREYDPDLYMMAKNAAMIARAKEAREHESLWADEEEPEEQPSPSEVAANSEIDVPRPEQVAAEAAAAVELPAE